MLTYKREPINNLDMPGKNFKSAEAQMLIRKPASEVFEAFSDPGITRNFWFTRGSGRLEVGKEVTWEWEMYKVSARVMVKEMVSGQKIVIEWGEPSRTVEFDFQAVNEGFTYVTIREWGFLSTGDALLEDIKGSTAGFTTVLDGLKAFLEFRINLNLIADKFPPEITSHGN
jgi:uncharacterized protein YndB with AHSA1/START domain